MQTNPNLESLYLERFKKLQSSDKTYTLKSNFILVERLKEPERRTKGGIILAADDGSKQINAIGADMPNFCIVLDVGEGYSDDEGNIIPNSLDVKVGDIVLIPRLSIKYFSLYQDLEDYKPDTIGISKDTEIQMTFNGIEGYQKYFETLNKMVE